MDNGGKMLRVLRCEAGIDEAYMSTSSFTCGSSRRRREQLDGREPGSTPSNFSRQTNHFFWILRSSPGRVIRTRKQDISSHVRRRHLLLDGRPLHIRPIAPRWPTGRKMKKLLKELAVGRV
jgi:hypothetical protein